MASAVPSIDLNNGVQIPQLGFGTYPMDDAEAEALIPEALWRGYRLIDTAVNYGNERGVGEVLLTLGGDGAVLSTADGGLWSARPPAVTVRSTVGAGDSSLAGHLLASLAGAPPAERLRSAVAYGSASASLPGSAVPSPAHVDGSAVRVTAGLPGSSTPVPPPSVPAAGRDVL